MTLADQAPPSYRIDLRYIGTPFQGWQSQTQGTGIQDHLERALSTMLRHPTRVIGASRTDSGVHAEQQVGLFRTAVPYDEIRWLKSLNGILPPEIGVSAIAPVADDFHPIHTARAKAYRYRLWRGASRHPQIHPFCWPLYRDLDLERMRVEARELVGTHDFTSFCALDSGAKTRQRTVLEVEIVEAGPLVDVWVVGKGFLKQMVRIMVGTLVEIGLGKHAPGAMREALLARDRDAAGVTAPPNGLSLVAIFYDEIATVAALRERLGREYAIRTV